MCTRVFVRVALPSPLLASGLPSAAVDSQLCTNMSIKFLLIEDTVALRLFTSCGRAGRGGGELRATDWLQALRRRAEINLQ